MPERELLMTITRKDFAETHIRGTGPGGQHRNKSHTGVRLQHAQSGVTTEATDSRHQEQNRREAFRKMAAHPEFVRWVHNRALDLMGVRTVDERVADTMRPENIRTQVRRDGKWVDVDPSELTD